MYVCVGWVVVFFVVFLILFFWGVCVGFFLVFLLLYIYCFVHLLILSSFSSFSSSVLFFLF